MSEKDEPGISVTEFEHRHPEFRNEQDWVGPAWLRALADCERTDADLSRKVPREHLREHAAELDAQADQWERDRNEIERLREGLRDAADGLHRFGALGWEASARNLLDHSPGPTAS